MKLKIYALFFINLFLVHHAIALDAPEMRAVYCASFEVNTQSSCQQIVDNVLSSNINAVFVQVRARGDASYYPNREDTTYPNPEPRGQLYSLSPSDLDVLQFFIDRLHNADPPREVHAWCTTFNTWNRSWNPPSPDHVYNAHKEWITENRAGITYTYSDDAPLDPGIPEVQDYVYDVFMDIVRNYDIDGIHFDYIRLIDQDSGYDPVAKSMFLSQTGWNYDTDNTQGQLDEVYKAWRRDQLARLVQRIHTQTMLEKPWVEVSAFLIKFTDPVEYLGCGYNWWVAHGAIDALHPSCYSSSASGTVTNWEKCINKLKQNGDENKIPVIAAIGNYLLPAPSEIVNVVDSLRSHSRKADGFNFFRHEFVYNGDPSQAEYLFNPEGPMDGWAPVPFIPHKTNEETIPPNPPSSFAVTLSENIPHIVFTRPAPAPDGDLPVHYRLYRDKSLPIRLYYENMIMEWWDMDSARETFSFDDDTSETGALYYAALSYDNWNNQSDMTTGTVTVTSTTGKISASSIPKEPKPPVVEPLSTVTEVIVDSEPTSLDYDDAGAWSTHVSGTSYQGSARHYPAASFPIDSCAVWVVDIPRAGYWAIDGHVSGEQESLGRGIQYRFVDGRGVIRNVTTTQRTGSAGFTIDVDGVPDEKA
ncbi:family 10 glycosylhydrolase, partial [Candidatus Sumerlaeota bacterium]|nr:family 10 glycosylhydrolase [Candidatus Sumerlaeota bacterium]